ncbi:MAG: glycoside hydrolase family 75 protein [Verrucomicrobiales bacterium]|nr:glycoside hydrolase family 75 protein [Verrucomicrobiales bacterium]
MNENSPAAITQLVFSFLFLPFISSAESGNLKNWVEVKEDATASALRGSGKTFLKEIQFSVPKPATTLEELSKINPSLKTVLPGLPSLFASAEVSPRYKQLYDTKIRYMKGGVFPTTHNYFDCETVLQLTHPETGRKVFWLQGDMDVVTDGSDPGRAAELSDYDLARTSNSFLPFTKYGWSKSGSTPKNPFVEYYPEVIKELEEMKTLLMEKAANDKGLIWREMLATCEAQLKYAKGRGNGTTFQKWTNDRRYVVATTDPFVVLPNSWLSGSSSWTPKAGNYAAVVYKGKIYPAILGDSGPESKVGEASLKIARSLNPNASGRVRAIDDVSVSYLVFPGTRAPAQEPDLAEWREEVIKLLGEIGGVSSESIVHIW